MPPTVIGIQRHADHRQVKFFFDDGRKVYLSLSPLSTTELIDLEEVGFEPSDAAPASHASKVGPAGELLGFLFYDDGPETQAELADRLAAIPRDGLYGLEGAMHLVEVYVGGSHTPHTNTAELVAACERQLRSLIELLRSEPLPIAREALNPT